MLISRATPRMADLVGPADFGMHLINRHPDLYGSDGQVDDDDGSGADGR